MNAVALLIPILALGGLSNGAVTRPRSVEETLTIDNGLDRGEWGPVDLCSANSYAGSFEIKYSGVGYFDDTSVNAIRLYCMTKEGALTNTIMSAEGSYGQWMGMRSCPLKQLLTGLRANVVPDQGTLGDDLGMDNLQMQCSGGSILDGQYGTPVKEGKGPVVERSMTHIEGREMEVVHMKIKQSADARDFGDWGSWQSCSPGNFVCGLEVRLEDDHVFDDDAGVSDVRMFCCK